MVVIFLVFLQSEVVFDQKINLKGKFEFGKEFEIFVNGN